MERRLLIAIAQRLPLAINSDHLTALALAAMLLAGCSYAVARIYPLALYVAIFWIAVNWFGDSLDGTIARVRNQQRPRYGFYVDHVVDCVGASLLMGGLAVSGYMSPGVAAAVLIGYLLVSAEVYLATYCVGEFRMSYWGFGPTELRIVLAVGTAALVSDPRVTVFDWPYRLFDVGGVVAAVSLIVTFVVTGVGHARALYRAEPLASGR